jgi:coniferyl-aldehyde dehydrogenase
MSLTKPEPTNISTGKTDRERFGDLLDVQRSAYLRDGAPSLGEAAQ